MTTGPALVAESIRPGTRTIGAGADGLAIADLTPLSTCDWPGRLVATAFLQAHGAAGTATTPTCSTPGSPAGCPGRGCATYCDDAVA